MMDPTDEELVRNCLAGQTEAYSELVRRYESRVLNFAHRALNDRALAEDLSQEVFVRAYRSLGRFRQDRKFRPWLMAIAANRIRDHLKSRGRRQEVTWDLSQTEKSRESDPLDRAAARQLLNRLETRIQALPEETQEILRLRFKLGLDYDEVAETMGLALGTVKSRISRTRVLLRKSLSEVME